MCECIVMYIRLYVFKWVCMFSRFGGHNYGYLVIDLMNEVNANMIGELRVTNVVTTPLVLVIKLSATCLEFSTGL